jgi:hypothetical protein
MTTFFIHQAKLFEKTDWKILLLSVLSVLWAAFGNAAPLDVWHQRDVPFLLSTRLSQVAYGNGAFVALGEPETLLTSSDGTDWFWNYPPIEVNDRDTRLSFLNNLFFATIPLATSSDGIVWTNHFSPSVSGPRFLTYGNGVFVGISEESDALLISADGLAWTDTGEHGFYPSSVTFGGGLFVAVGQGSVRGSGLYGMILTSSNGRGWTYRRVVEAVEEVPRSVIYGNGRFVIHGFFGHTDVDTVTNILTSTDGLTWTAHIAPGSLDREEDAPALAFGGGMFVMGGVNGTNFNLFVASSVDAANWVVHDLGTNYNYAQIRSLVYGSGTFVAVADNNVEGFILQSDNLASGQPADPPSLALKMYPGLTITGTIGRRYAIESTTDVEAAGNWQAVASITLQENPFLWFDLQGTNTPKRFYRAREIAP